MSDQYVFGSREPEVDLAGSGHANHATAGTGNAGAGSACEGMGNADAGLLAPTGNTIATKTCPRCGQILFADMDVCYGCLYDFSRHSRAEKPAGTTGAAMPALEEELLPGDLLPEELLPDEPASGGPTSYETTSYETVSDESASYEQTPHEMSSDGLLPGRLVEFARQKTAPAEACPTESTSDTMPLSQVKLAMYALSQSADTGTAAAPAQPVSLWIRTGDIDVTVPIPKRGLSIGREPSCNVVLHSQAVSRRHLLVTPDPKGACFHDLGSTNRALYQGRTIDGSTLIPFDAPVILCGVYLVPRRVAC